SVDGLVHSIAHAPASCLGAGLLGASAPDVATTLEVSATSLARLVGALLPLMPEGASVVAMDFDSSERTFPSYDWMGVAKAALGSTARYLAREPGPRAIRVNLVSAGPLPTPSGMAIPSFDELAAVWAERAPLGWGPADTFAVGNACVALLSDLFSRTT